MSLSPAITVLATLGLLFGLASVAPAARAQAPGKPTKPKVTFCTGQKDGKYEELGKTMRTYVRSAELEIVNTEGTLDNLERLAAGACQVAVVQPDGLTVFKRQSGKSLDAEFISKAHPEFVHLYCNKDSGVDRITDLTARRMRLSSWALKGRAPGSSGTILLPRTRPTNRCRPWLQIR